MKTQYVYDHYYDYAELTAVLQSFAESYPSLFRLSSIGTTPEGRNIWLAEVNGLHVFPGCPFERLR